MAGSGSYVDVSEDHIDELAAGYANGEALLNEKFWQTFTITGELFNEVKDYLDQYQSTLDTYTLPTGLSNAIGDVYISPVDSIGMLNTTNIPTINLPSFGEIPFPIMPALKAAPDIDLSFTKPTKPIEINPSLGYTITPYNSVMWYELFSAVYDGIVNGGTGLANDVETAIFARGAERNRLANDKLYRTLIRDRTARGCKFPAIALRTIEVEVSKEIHRQETNRSNEIAIAQAELAQANTHFMLDKGVALEQILRTFWQTYESMDLDAKKAAADLVIRNYELKWNAYINEISAELEIKKMMTEGVKTVIAENELLGQAFKIESDNAIARVEKISAERESLVEAYKVDGQVYEAITRAQSTWYNALTDNQRAQLEESRLKLEQAVEAAKIEMDGSISINTLKEKILEAMSNVAAQVLASALNAVNASIGHSTSASENRSESWSHSDNIGETHSFDETAT